LRLPRKAVEIDVAAADDDPDALAADVDRPLEQAGERHGGRRLDRERGLRARIGYNIGQPRTIGLTLRQSFGGRRAAPPPPRSAGAR